MNKFIFALSSVASLSNYPASILAFTSFHNRFRNRNNLIPSDKGHRHLPYFRKDFSPRFHSVMNSSAGEMESDQTLETKKVEDKPKKSQPTKLHTVTVCVVPPPENLRVWETLAEIRKELKDPGYYRWPPHVNLLYPFVKLPRPSDDADPNKEGDCTLSDIVEKLESATRTMSPFVVQLNRFGTFGGKKRGVLWLHPESTSGLPEEASTPLIQLQASLEEAFPMCGDQSKKGGGFTPHMTVSHFPSLDDALEAQGTMETSYSLTDTDRFQFLLDRIYLLERKGDQGQFLRVAEIALGANSSQTKIFDLPQPFPDMPKHEEEWVYNERMQMKSRRKSNNRRRRGKKNDDTDD